MSDVLRRLRHHAGLRNLVREIRLDPCNFVYPIFVSETATAPEPIPSMLGQFRLPLSSVAKEVCEAEEIGIGGVLLFGLPSHKDDQASASADPNGIVARAIRAAKSACPEMVVISDVCVCGYTHHGHCGVLKGERVDNDLTLNLLADMAIVHAQSGADIVAPSSMMDNQVGAIRQALDSKGLAETAILGYSAKFASGFYGPFRDAADSAPAFGDRSSYQHEPANLRHAEREILADVAEGADMLLIKPGLAYLDVVRLAHEITRLPIVSYNVSGEYAMVKAAAERGWLDERKIVLETLTAFRRAGADLVITYHAKDASRWLREV